MPTTVNGVGTHYYGRKNAKVRSGVCRSCGQSAVLTSYDTRLWFVVLFIPVIPLGRKRIIDECSRCRRHWAANQDQYEMSRQLSVSGALQRYREQPSPQGALEVHAVLLGFHEHDQAEKFRQAALDEFPDSADLAAGLAGHMDEVGRYDEAAQLFAKAHELDPNLPQARFAMGMYKIHAGQLDEAQRLFDYLMVPGAGQNHSLGPLETLAREYQKKGRHAETLEICRHLLAELPAAGEHREFRKLVQASEQAVGERASILPTLPFRPFALLSSKNTLYPTWVRRTVIGGFVTTVVLIALAVNNDHIRRNRTVHVLNAFSRQVQVAIDGGPATTINGQAKLTLPEGRHHVQISGPIDEAFDIDLQSGYFARWFKNPAWILNVAGATTLAESRIVYAVAPPPITDKLIPSEPFTFRPDVDYVLVAAPEKMQVKGHNQQIVKTRLEVIPASPEETVVRLAAKSPALAMAFAEDQLPQHSENLLLLYHYAELGKEHGEQQRVVDFLKAGCAKRPVAVNWHRVYQTFLEESGQEENLIAEYDAQLAADPIDGRLLYLRGRIDPDSTKARTFFDRAIAADPTLTWPWVAIAYQAVSRGQWSEATKALEKARELKIDETQLGNLAHVAALAAGDRAQLEATYRQRLTEPQSVATLLQLEDLLAVQDRPDDARQTLSQWIARVVPQRTPEIEASLAPLEQQVLYLIGDFAGLEASLTKSGDAASPQSRAQLLLSTARAEQAAADPSLAKVWENPWEALALSVALGLGGHSDDSTAWRERACAGLAKRGTDDRQSARFLTAETPAPIKDVMQTSMDLHEKVMLLAALSQRFPEQRAAYIEALGKLNVSHMWPYHLVNQVVLAAKP